MDNISPNLSVWFAFAAFIVFALIIDALFLNKKISRPYQSMRAAILWTVVWIACALIFNLLLLYYLWQTTNPAFATQKALDFLAGFIIEESLSIDNLFTFYIIFQQFHIPIALQQRVFSYGIYSALVLRLLLILCGVWLIERYHWILYIMGLFLILTGIKIFLTREKSSKTHALTSSPIFLFLKRHLRVTENLHGENFFVKQNNIWYATPLLITLIFIEISDIIFAFDSIPAIFAITRDPFIVWTSNIFAIIGLRALYFFIANLVRQFYLLKYAIGLILVFVGTKIIIAPWVSVSAMFSLGIIASILFLFSLLSVLIVKYRQRRG